MDEQKQHPSGLSRGKNHITAHTPTASSTFLPSNLLPPTPHYKTIPHTLSTFADLHTTPLLPVPLTTDIPSTLRLIQENTHPAYIPPTGIRFCRTDTPPGGISPMHRTLSLDYVTVIEGSIELVLEGGESRVLEKGDTVVQRATMHQWRNGSETEWCRMSVVMMPIGEEVVGGVRLVEEFKL